MSEDSIGFDGGINFFAYVGNNPVNFFDPFGLCDSDPMVTIQKISGELWKALKAEKSQKCLKFLTSGPRHLDPVAVLKDFEMGTNTTNIKVELAQLPKDKPDAFGFTTRSIKLDKNNNVTAGTIQIFLQGGFFRDFISGQEGTFTGSLATDLGKTGGGAQAQAETLIHEIGHLTGVLVDEPTTEGGREKNAELIKENCLELINNNFPEKILDLTKGLK